MCGIIGYVGHRPAVPVVMEGLSRLEYRGYDSAGVAWHSKGKLEIVKAQGKIAALEKKLESIPPILATCAMGHTRWATHGLPVERNAHPHISNERSLAIVHNGIVENYQELKTLLAAHGYSFYSDTDTEVLANLIAWKRAELGNFLEAFAAALRMAHGAYAVCAMDADTPDCLYAARMSAPLIAGAGVGENFVASDIPAFLPYTRDVLFLEDGEILQVTRSNLQVLDMGTLEPLERARQTVQWDMQAAQKEGYRHFMLKEIFEQPRVIKDACTGRIENEDASLSELDPLPVPGRIVIVACGTSWHSGLWARSLLESISAIPVQVEIASEFRYKEKYLAREGDMAIFISQSGETADTLAAMRIAKANGFTTVGLCNVVGSALSRETDACIFTQAGPEISVASTKAMCSQMVTLLLMALYFARRQGIPNTIKRKKIIELLRKLPELLTEELPAMKSRASELARAYSGYSHFFYLGRGAGWPLALEGALKLKELSYIHAEGYAAGEMKHGPIALVDPAFPSFAIALNDQNYPRIKSNIQEVRARSGKVICLTHPETDVEADDLWVIPYMEPPLDVFVVLPALQLFSYEVADYLGKDVDQPRNLAKSVTVE